MGSPWEVAGGESENEWEARYRAGDTPWEKGAPHPALVHWLSRRTLRGRVLVPGCGSGHDVRAIASTGAAVTGLEIAPSAILAARSFPVVGGETYVRGDVFNPPQAWRGAFDWVFEHTCFCAIAPARRREYADAIKAVLNPDGRLLAVFFLNPDHDDAGPPFGCSRDELDALFSDAFRLQEEHVDPPTFPGREGREILRLLTRR